MTRIEGVSDEQADDAARRIFAAQTKQWGAPLLPNRYYARRPTILRAVNGMWAGLAASGLVDERLRALLNRRVAALNRCEF
jgi:hypothetical protein